jgi:hypothetical protein
MRPIGDAARSMRPIGIRPIGVPVRSILPIGIEPSGMRPIGTPCRLSETRVVASLVGSSASPGPHRGWLGPAGRFGTMMSAHQSRPAGSAMRPIGMPPRAMAPIGIRPIGVADRSSWRRSSAFTTSRPMTSRNVTFCNGTPANTVVLRRSGQPPGWSIGIELSGIVSRIAASAAMRPIGSSARVMVPSGLSWRSTARTSWPSTVGPCVVDVGVVAFGRIALGGRSASGMPAPAATGAAEAGNICIEMP